MTEPRFPPPTTALLSAAHRRLGHGTVHVALSEAELRALPDFAQRHGLLRLGADALDAAGAPSAHEGRTDVAARLRRQAVEALRQQAELADIVAAFASRGVPVVTMKGVPLSAWLYGDAAFRQSADIDLLVLDRDRHAAGLLLVQMGYCRRIESGAGEVVYSGAGCWPMRHASRVPVDLHWRTWGVRFQQPLTSAAILEEAGSVPLGPRSIPVPAPSHAAIIVLTHAAKHVWYSLESVLAIARLMGRTDVDWDAVYRITAASRVDTAAAAGLRLASDLLRAEIPSPFRSLARSGDIAAAASHGLAALCLPPRVFPDGDAEARAHTAWMVTSGDRLRYRVVRAAEPTYADWSAVPLPSALAPLYVPIRLGRLAWRRVVHGPGGRDAIDSGT